MKKILDIGTPLITVYTHHAYELMVLANLKEANKWIFCNYIRLYMNKDLNGTPWGDFYFSMPYEIKCYEKCPFLRVQKNDIAFILDNYAKVAQYVKASIDNGYCLHIMVDYYYVSQSRFYGKVRRNHDCFIYGYDDETEELYCADFMLSDNRKIGYGTMQFDEFEKACRSAAVEKEGILNGYVYGLKPVMTDNYEFDIHNIIYGLEAYVEGKVPEYWLDTNYCNKSNISWGLNCYDSYIDYLNNLDGRIDDRFLCLFSDHKIMMVKRLEFLEDELHITGLKPYIEEYNGMYQELKRAVNLLLKYDICKNKDMLFRAINIIAAEKEKEEACLLSVINVLKNYCGEEP